MKLFPKSSLSLAAVLALSATSADAVVVTVTDVFGHNEQDNFGQGFITDMIIGSGMNGYGNDGNPGWPAGEGDPSTWSATSNAWQAEWQSRDLLDAGESPTNGKIGWTTPFRTTRKNPWCPAPASNSACSSSPCTATCPNGR